MASDECSLEAFKEERLAHAKKREIIYEAFKSADGPISDYDVAAKLQWPISCVMPRRLELEVAGRVLRIGQREQGDDRRVNVFIAR